MFKANFSKTLYKFFLKYYNIFLKFDIKRVIIKLGLTVFCINFISHTLQKCVSHFLISFQLIFILLK